MARWGKPTDRAADYRGPVYALRRHQHHHGVLLNPCAEQVLACCETPKIGSRFITEGGCRKVAFIRLAIYNLPVSSSCVFCNIVSGTETASVVYDDSWTLAFIDIRQPRIRSLQLLEDPCQLALCVSASASDAAHEHGDQRRAACQHRAEYQYDHEFAWPDHPGLRLAWG